MTSLNKILGGILDILLPKTCIACKKEGQYICKECEVFLSETPNNFKDLFTVWEYEGLMEKTILKIKYDGVYDMVDELVEKAFKKIELRLPADTYITYVPMYKKAEKRRGFNQAELIARKIGKITGKRVVKLLQKTIDNLSQVGLAPKERFENVKDVFSPTALLKEAKSHSATILLVDDVYTTGATMNECTKVLKKAGIKYVLGFAIARKFNV